nr:MAG TPA: hypothetical protein [Caudoviricetes sp.]
MRETSAKRVSLFFIWIFIPLYDIIVLLTDYK